MTRMHRRFNPLSRRAAVQAVATALLVVVALLLARSAMADEPTTRSADSQLVRCATLIYGHGNRVKMTVCFSEAFLQMAGEVAHIDAAPTLTQVRSESDQLFNFPFAVLAGEGLWTFTEAQRENVGRYLKNGGFMLASAGCGSRQWASIFREEMLKIFPGTELQRLPADHPVYDIVYDLKSAEFEHRDNTLPELWGLTVNGRTAVIFSPNGLNDTDNAGAHCCCCGGSDEKYAPYINVNILAYALTH